jgi:hypothetical protein
VQVAQVGNFAAGADHAGDRQEAAAGADAGHVERGDFADAEAGSAGGPQHLQGGGDIGQQGGIVAIQFGVQHALGQGLERLGIEAGEPGQILAGRLGWPRVDGGGDSRRLHRARRRGAARTAPAGRHAVLAGGDFCGIGQVQCRQGLQRRVLGAADGAEEAQPVARLWPSASCSKRCARDG